jgi:hypothetical protein
MQQVVFFAKAVPTEPSKELKKPTFPHVGISQEARAKQLRMAGVSMIFMCFLLGGMFFGFVRYAPYESHPDEQVTQYYQYVSRTVFFLH